MPTDDPRAQRPGVFLPQPTGQPPYTSQLPPGTVTAQAQSIFNTQDPNSLLAWLEQQLPGGLANFLLALIQRGVCACSAGGTSMFWEYVGTILRNALADTPGIKQIHLQPSPASTETRLDLTDDGTIGGSLVELLSRSTLFLQSVNDEVDIVAQTDIRLNAPGSIVMTPSSDVTVITGTVNISTGPGGINLNPATVVSIDRVSFNEEVAAVGPVGAIVGKVPIRDNAGTLIGYFPVYNAIT